MQMHFFNDVIRQMHFITSIFVILFGTGVTKIIIIMRETIKYNHRKFHTKGQHTLFL